MQKSYLWALALTFTLTACQAQVVSAPVSPTPTPSPLPTPVITPEPTPLPSPTPSATPQPTPTPTVTFEPQALPSLIPVPTPVGTPWQGQGLFLDRFNGRIFDEKGSALQGVKVRVEFNLEGFSPYSEETLTDATGSYHLNAPSGALIKIHATYPNRAARTRIEVLKIGAIGHPFANRFDFGVNEEDYRLATDQYIRSSMDISRGMTLADAPEVIAVLPELKTGTQLASDTALKLTFSEPVDRSSFEKTVAVRSYKEQKLRVDHLSGQPSLSGSGDVNQPNGSLIWTAEAFDFVWNVGDTSVSLNFKPGHGYPANNNNQDFPMVVLSFNAPERGSQGLADKTGASRDQDWFRLLNSAPSQSLVFTIAQDTTPFGLKNLDYQAATATNPPVLRLSYNKPIWYSAKSRVIAGGMADFFNLPGAELQAPAEYPGNQGNATARNAAKNYRVLILKPSSLEPTLFSGTWYELGGHVVYDQTDPSHSRVLLQLPAEHDKTLFASGNEIQINGVTSVLDPAGNALTVGTPLKVLVP